MSETNINSTRSESELDLQYKSEEYFRSLSAEDQKSLSDFQKTQTLIKTEKQQWDQIRIPLLSNARQLKAQVMNTLGTAGNVCVDVTNLLSDYTKLALRTPRKSATNSSDDANALLTTTKTGKPRKRVDPKTKPCFLRIKNTVQDQTWSMKMLTNWLDSVDPQFAARCFLEATTQKEVDEREDDDENSDADTKNNRKKSKNSLSSSATKTGEIRKKIPLTEETKLVIADKCRRFAQKIKTSMTLTCTKPSTSATAKTKTSIVDTSTFSDTNRQMIQQYLSCQDEYTRRNEEYKPRQKELRTLFKEQSAAAKDILSRFSKLQAKQKTNSEQENTGDTLFNCKVLATEKESETETNDMHVEKSDKPEDNKSGDRDGEDDDGEDGDGEDGDEDQDTVPEPKTTEFRLKHKVHTVKTPIKFKAMPKIVELAMNNLRRSAIAYSMDVFREFIIRAYNEYTTRHSKTEERVRFHKTRNVEYDD